MNTKLSINIDKRQIYFNYHCINFSLFKGRVIFEDMPNIKRQRLYRGVLKELDKPINLKTKLDKGFTRIK